MDREKLEWLKWINNQLIDKYPMIYEILKEQYEKIKGRR